MHIYVFSIAFHALFDWCELYSWVTLVLLKFYLTKIINILVDKKLTHSKKRKHFKKSIICIAWFKGPLSTCTKVQTLFWDVEIVWFGVLWEENKLNFNCFCGMLFSFVPAVSFYYDKNILGHSFTFHYSELCNTGAVRISTHNKTPWWADISYSTDRGC